MSEQNLADSIAMLEQILEVMPHDVDALKALYTANLNNGLPDRAFDYLGRMVDFAADTGDPKLFAYLENQLGRFVESHPSEAAAQQARLRTLKGVHQASPEPAAAEESPAEKIPPRTETPEIDVTEELALAWKLYEEDQLSQDEYSTVLHDLTEVSSKALGVPASVLHVLKDRGFPNTSRILSFLSERAEIPFVQLSNFEIEDDAANALPEEFYKKDGVLPFGFLGRNLLVAVLNPLNKGVIDRAEQVSGSRCHTYLVEADDYDLALEKIKARSAVA